MAGKIEIIKDEYIDVLERIKERITQAQYQICLLYTSPSPRDRG